MKKISLFAILTLSYSINYAQDTIVKSNGEQIVAKILEISTTDVKYKKFIFQEGPTYVESKSNIQLIRYSNGTKEEFETQAIKTADAQKDNSDYYSGPVNTNNKIEKYGNHYRYQNEALTERKMQEVLFKSKDKQIMSLAGKARDAKGLQYIGFVAIPLGVTGLVLLTRNVFNPYSTRANVSRDLTLSAICFIGAVSCPIASGIFKHKRNVSNREAVKLYNERF